MAKTFKPQLDVLPAAQRALWAELKHTPTEFILYGGTAIALQLGHRESVDFDFFSLNTIDPRKLLTEVPYLQGARVIQREENTLTCLVERDGVVKMSFFGLPNLKQIEEPILADDNALPVATLVDLAGTKVEVVQARSEAKDYIDIDALMTKGNLSLAKQLAAGRQVFGSQYEPTVTLKALCYYGDGNLNEVSEEARERLIDAVQTVDPLQLPSLRRMTRDKGKLER